MKELDIYKNIETQLIDYPNEIEINELFYYLLTREEQREVYDKIDKMLNKIGGRIVDEEVRLFEGKRILKLKYEEIN